MVDQAEHLALEAQVGNRPLCAEASRSVATESFGITVGGCRLLSCALRQRLFDATSESAEHGGALFVEFRRQSLEVALQRRMVRHGVIVRAMPHGPVPKLDEHSALSTVESCT
jgi:hypothetical protein